MKENSEPNATVDEQIRNKKEKAKSFCNIDDMIVSEIMNRNVVGNAQKSLYNTCVHLRNYSHSSRKNLVNTSHADRSPSGRYCNLNNYMRILSKGKV